MKTANQLGKNKKNHSPKESKKKASSMVMEIIIVAVLLLLVLVVLMIIFGDKMGLVNKPWEDCKKFGGKEALIEEDCATKYPDLPFVHPLIKSKDGKSKCCVNKLA